MIVLLLAVHCIFPLNNALGKQVFPFLLVKSNITNKKISAIISLSLELFELPEPDVPIKELYREMNQFPFQLL